MAAVGAQEGQGNVEAFDVLIHNDRTCTDFVSWAKRKLRMEVCRKTQERGGGGDRIGLKVARMFGLGNRWWLGLRGNEKRRECD
jgi:hypothetical protein